MEKSGTGINLNSTEVTLAQRCHETVTAFHAFAKADPSKASRGNLWDVYVVKREQYLKALWGNNYRPLMIVSEKNAELKLLRAENGHYV